VIVGDSETTGLESFLQGLNVDVGRGFIVEPRLNLRGRAEAVLISLVNQTHPILEPLNNQVILVLRAAPLKTGKPGGANPAANGFLVTELLRTSNQSWAELDLAARTAHRDEKDLPGPLTVGVAVNERPKPDDREPGAPRLVVFSSRYLGDNATVQIAPSNLDLLMNSVNWLRGRPELAGIAPKTHESLTLTADSLLRARLILVPTVLAVLLIITLGVSTYLLRRE
jgi:hypothetical protein